MTLRLLFVLMLALPTLLAAAPPADPWFERLRVADGLPSSYIYTIRQAPDGFIWIGSTDGLARYDGVDFRVWRHDPMDPGSLSTNDISAVLLDSKGRLWCGGEAGGVNQMLEDGSFRHYRHAANDPRSLGSDDVFTIAEDAAGAIWVGTYLGGLNRLREDGSFERLEHDADDPRSLRSTTVISLFGDAQGRLWIGTDKGLDVREADGRIVHVDLQIFERAGGNLKIGSFLPEADGSMLVGTQYGIARISRDLEFVEDVAPGVVESTAMAMVREPDGRFWIATTSGLISIDGGKIQRYGREEPLPGDVPSERAMDVLRDHEGGLWFAFFDGGVARLSARAHSFSSWRHYPGRTASLLHNAVESVSVDQRGDVWATSGGNGLDRIDALTGRVERFGARLDAQRSRMRASTRIGDHLWVGHQRGLRRYSLTDDSMIDFSAASSAPSTLPAGFVLRLALAPEGILWAAVVGGGVARINTETLEISNFTAGAGTLGNNDILSLVLDRDSLPWIAGATGVERYDPATGRFNVVTGSPNEPIHALAFSADGSLWLHRLGALEHYRLDDGKLALSERYGIADGWPAMRIGDLHVAADESVWASSQRGLWRLDGVRHNIRRFSEGDGLPSSEFVGAFATGADGSVYAATRGGVIAFDPASIVLNAPPSPLHLTELTIRRQGNTQILKTDRAVELRHDDRDLSIELRALSFLDRGGNRYLVRLDGFDADWFDAGALGQRVYSQLPAGQYLLRARAANADGAWSELSPLPISVSPAPWATPLAWLIYAAISSILAILWLRAWRSRVDQRHAFEFAEAQRRNAEQLAAAKSGFLATMSHEIRTPMTGVLGMAELLRETPLDVRQRGYAEAISRSGELMLRLVNDSLDLARIEAGKLELEHRPFDPRVLMQEVAAIGDPLAVRKGLGFDLVIAKNTPQYVMGDAMRIKQVLHNLVNNAIKFTGAGRVVLGVDPASATHLEFHVSDTGPGMSASMLERLFGRFEQSDGVTRRFGGSGLGLSICQELVELMGGSIRVESSPGHGARFSVELPLPETRTKPEETSASWAASASDRVSAERTGGTTDTPMHVLVVEDDATIAAVIVGMLEAAGHRATHAEHGLAALTALSDPGIGLALLDLDLPGVDGLQLARMLRAREASTSAPRLPLIAISARSNGDEDEQVRAAGMDAFLRKPLSAAALEAVMAPLIVRSPEKRSS